MRRPSRYQQYQPYAEPKTTYASCMLTDPNGETGVAGQVILEQTEGQQTHMEAFVTGLTEGSHGFYVHQNGDLSQGCASVGSRFEPEGTNYGAHVDVADLKDLNADYYGVAAKKENDLLIDLTGEDSVIGRAIVVQEADYGYGGHGGYGSGDGKQACCVIGRAQERPESIADTYRANHRRPAKVAKQSYGNRYQAQQDPNMWSLEKTHETRGQAPRKGQTVYVHYTGRLLDGTKFDSSVDRGTPFDFVLGQGGVIKCWDQGFEQMRVGEKAFLTCPSDYAYGARGSPPSIPGYATLEFEVELLAIY